MYPTLPFETADAFLASEVDYSLLLGKRYIDKNGARWRLVKLNNGADAAIAKKVLVWVSRSLNTVKLCTAKTDKVAGIGAPTMHVATTPDASYILIQETGRATVTHGDAHATEPIAAATPYAIPDDDADTGKAAGTALPAPGRAFGRYVSGTAADGADMVVELCIDEPQTGSAGKKYGFVEGRNGAGACTLAGAAVGDIVEAVFKSGDQSDNLTSGEGAVTAQPNPLFESVITVADQLQQASATDLSDNKYLVILSPTQG